MTVTRTSKLEGAHKEDVVSSTFSPDGSLFATGSLDGVVCIWRSLDKALLHIIDVPAAALILCWVAPGDKKILCGLKEGMIGCVDISESEVSLEVFTAHSHPVERIAVSGDVIASGAHEEVKLWKFGSSGQYFLVDILDPPLQDTLMEEGERETLVTGLHFIDFGSCIRGLAVIYMFHGLSIFDTQSRTRLYSVPLRGMIANSSLSYDGKLLATSRIFGGIDLYTIERNEVVHLRSLSREGAEIEGHILPVTFIKRLPLLVGGTNQGWIIIWDTRHGRQLANFRAEVNRPVTALSATQTHMDTKFVVCTRGSNFVFMASREQVTDAVSPPSLGLGAIAVRYLCLTLWATLTAYAWWKFRG